MVVQYQDRSSLLEALTGRSRIGGANASSAKSVNINGINVNVDDLRELLTPRLMYQWRG
jgi:hypothetical protein